MACLLDYIPALGEIIDRVLPDPKKAQELKAEIAKLQANENIARMGVLQAMLSNKSMFVAGGIPALIWLGVIMLFNNYVLLPWAEVFGLRAPQVILPEQYWTLLGWIITGLFGKKIIDNNAWYWKGKLISPSKKSLEASLMTGTVPVEKALDAQDYVDKRLQELKEELERKERVR